MENESMTTEKQINNNQALKNNQATETELIRGKNGVALFSDWHQPEQPEDYSREEITKLYRLRRDY